MQLIFTRHKENDKYQVRFLGQEFLIDTTEAERYIETGQAFYKTNKPVRSIKELESMVK